jgi:hypothetical protein
MTHPETCNDCHHKTWLAGSNGCTCICHMKTSFEDPPLPSASPEWIEFRKSMRETIPKPGSREDKITYHREYYERNKDKILANRMQHYWKNRDKTLAVNKAYHEANKDKIRAHHKEYLKVNKDKIFARRKEYYEKNRDKVIAYNKRYRDSKLNVND